ncbi:MAG: lysophospholipid acyltransferase family protein [Pseudomonadota bacterium]
MTTSIFLFCRAIIFYLGYSLSLIPHATLCVLFGWMLPIKTRYRYVVMWNTFVVWWVNVTCGVSYRVTGVENIPSHPFVLLSNHQSPWETIFLYTYFSPLCATLKRELLRIPFFGWALATLNPIAIDRSKRIGARQTLLVEGKKRLYDGISVLVFPEGTRIAPGVEKKYSSGGAELAITAEAIILPVAHNAGLFWPSHKFLKRPGIVDVIIGKPVPAKGRDARELTEEIQTWTREVLRTNE